jgi:hypothetical protein
MLSSDLSGRVTMKRINITQGALRAGFVGTLATAAIAAIAFASDSPPPAPPAQANVTDPNSVPKFANAYAVNATPEQLAAIAAEQSNAKAAMSAYIDADSGHLRVITAEDLQAGAAPDAVQTGVATYRPDGLVMFPLDESSAAYYVANIGKDGKLREACLENQPNAAAALAKATTQAEVGSNEK